MRSTRTIHIVVASPGDVAPERDALDDVINAAARLTRYANLTLKLDRWEDVAPGFDSRGVQTRIEDHLQIGQCDVVIGVFWKRFGDLDANNQSRTQREIEAALKQRESGETTPEVMVYFCTRPSTTDSAEEAEEHARVLKFKKHLQNRNVMTIESRTISSSVHS